MQDVFIEHLVKRRNTGANAAIQALAVIAALLLTLASLLFLPMFLPLVAVVSAFGAYYVITSQNVEFEYSVTNGEVDVDKITAKRKRKRLLSIDCRTAESFGRYRPEEHQNKQYQKKVFACDRPDSPDLWYCTARQHGGLTLLVFCANQKILDAVKPFLPRAISREAFQSK